MQEEDYDSQSSIELNSEIESLPDESFTSEKNS